MTTRTQTLPPAEAIFSLSTNTETASKEQMLRHFEEQGYLILKGFLSPDVVEQARVEMDKLVDQRANALLAEGKIKDTLQDAPFETRLYELYRNNMGEAPKSFRKELQGEGLFQLFFNPAVLDVAEMFLGPEIRLYPNYTARPKLPEHAATLVLWHQDGGYTEVRAEKPGSVDALRMINLWTPLVPVNVENGCMQFVPGTHKLGVVPHESREHYLQITRDYLDRYEDQAVDIELEPGDVVLFHNLLFHRGLPNHSSTVRWSLDWRYQDATQPTLRQDQGHIARSLSHPESAVRSPAEWAHLTWR